MVQSLPVAKSQSYTLWFNEIGLDDIHLVGGKNASLGEMFNNLSKRGVNIPNGFCVTATSYYEFIKPVVADIKLLMNQLEFGEKSNSAKIAEQIQNLITTLDFPADIQTSITENYKKLCQVCGNIPNLSVAVRSSSIAEDSEDASFAGQHSSYLHQRGDLKVLDAVRRCFASMFTERAIIYRKEKNMDPLEDGLSVTIQKMVYTDNSSAGVMFSIDPGSHNTQFIFIEASFGLNEANVGGLTNPDQFYAYKPNVLKNIKPIVARKLGDKQITMVHNSRTGEIEEHQTSRYNRKSFAITLAEATLLAKWAVIIEEYYSEKKGSYCPMDMEWGKDELTGELFILQARPETTNSTVSGNIMKIYKLLDDNHEVIAQGVTGSPGICTGKVRVLHDLSQMNEFQEGEILVTESTSPDWMPVLRKCAGVITEQGGATCHASIVTRELGKPSIVGVDKIIDKLSYDLSYGNEVTIDSSKGSVGVLYEGLCNYEVKNIELNGLPETETNVYLNTAKPDEAFNLSNLPVKGVGLLRSEFIINNIGIHPMALENYHTLDSDLRDKISNKTPVYNKKTDYFVDEFAFGISQICAAFYPRPVIVRMADLKSNEYRELLGGELYEPQEENPMLGWRGAARYIDPKYRPAFDLECIALRRVRETMQLDNLVIMIPFCRSLREGEAVIQALADNGLVRGENGLKVYVMAELPINVLCAEEFCDIFDGFSIGSNDLTQLTLGIDRDAGNIAKDFDETNPGVLRNIQLLFDNVRRYEQRTGQKRYIGICGQGPSNKPHLVKWLLERGINSVSLTEDAVFKTILNIAEAEGKDVSQLRRKIEM